MFYQLLESRVMQARPRPAWMAARLYSDPSGLVGKLNRELFRDVNERFLSALEHALPGCERRDLEVALQLTTGMLVHVLSGHVRAAESEPVRDGARPGSSPSPSSSYEPILQVLVRHAAAGLRGTPGAEA